MSSHERPQRSHGNLDEIINHGGKIVNTKKHDPPNESYYSVTVHDPQEDTDIIFTNIKDSHLEQLRSDEGDGGESAQKTSGSIKQSPQKQQEDHGDIRSSYGRGIAHEHPTGDEGEHYQRVVGGKSFDECMQQGGKIRGDYHLNHRGYNLYTINVEMPNGDVRLFASVKYDHIKQYDPSIEQLEETNPQSYSEYERA